MTQRDSVLESKAAESESAPKPRLIVLDKSVRCPSPPKALSCHGRLAAYRMEAKGKDCVKSALGQK
jgi:hypothetical protein